MKKSFMFFLVLSSGWACQKREYPTFDNSNGLTYLYQKQLVRELPTPEKPPVSTETRTLPEESETTKSVSFGSFSADMADEKIMVLPTIIGKDNIRSEKWQQIHLVPISHHKSEKPKASKTKNLGRLSFVLGSVGVLAALLPIMLSAPIWVFIAGSVIGTIGMIVGFIFFRQIKKQRIKPSNETEAIIGTALGIVTFLAGIMFLLVYSILTSAFGF